MEHTKLTELLNKVAQGEVSVEKAALELKTEPFEDLSIAILFWQFSDDTRSA